MQTSTTDNPNQGSSTDSSETTSEKPPDTTTSQDGYSEDSDDDSRNFFPSGYAPTGFPEDMEFHDHDTLISDKDTSGYLLLKVIFEELLARINRYGLHIYIFFLSHIISLTSWAHFEIEVSKDRSIC